MIGLLQLVLFGCNVRGGASHLPLAVACSRFCGASGRAAMSHLYSRSRAWFSASNPGGLA